MFVGCELVKDRASRAPATSEAQHVIYRLKQEYVLFSADGPHRNVLKFKPPMCFNLKNVDTLVAKLDVILTEIETTSPDGKATAAAGKDAAAAVAATAATRVTQAPVTSRGATGAAADVTSRAPRGVETRTAAANDNNKAPAAAAKPRTGAREAHAYSDDVSPPWRGADRDRYEEAYRSTQLRRTDPRPLRYMRPLTSTGAYGQDATVAVNSAVVTGPTSTRDAMTQPLQAPDSKKARVSDVTA